MDVPEALSAFLLGRTAITAVVRDRIYDGQIPAGTPLPAICVKRVAGTSHPHQRGAGTLLLARVQASCYALSSRAAAAVAKAVSAAIAPAEIDEDHPGFRGIHRDPQTPAESLFVASATPASDVELNEAPQSGQSDFPTHRALDFEIWYREESCQ